MEHASVHDNTAKHSIALIDSWGSESLAEQAYRVLERSIVTLELEPGAIVNERSLIELTGMGRTPIREAIQRLAWEGLVEVRPVLVLRSRRLTQRISPRFWMRAKVSSVCWRGMPRALAAHAIMNG